MLAYIIPLFESLKNLVLLAKMDTKRQLVKRLSSPFILWFLVIGHQLNGQVFNEIAEKKAQLDSISNPSTELHLLLYLAKHDADAGNALECANRAVLLADSLRNMPAKVEALRLSGGIWKDWGDNLRSAERLNEARDLAISLNRLEDLAIINRTLGETYRASANYTFAWQVLKDAEKHFKTSKNGYRHLARTYDRMAAIAFEEFNQHPEYENLKVYLKEKNHNISDFYNRFHELKHQYDTLNKYLTLGDAALDKSPSLEIEISLANIKAAYLGLVLNYEEALQEYDRILEKLDLNQNNKSYPLILINKAKILGFGNLNRLEESNQMAELALETSIKFKIKVYIYLSHEQLYRNHYALGNYKEAHEHLSQVNLILKQFHSDELRLKLNTLDNEYNLKTRLNRIQSNKIQFLVVLVAVLFILSALLIFLSVLFLKNKKLGVLLEELNQKNEIISAQNRDLTLANSTKDRFFSIIGHDLRGPISGISSLAGLLVEQIQQGKMEEITQYAELIQNSSEKSMILLSNLLTWAKSQTGKIEFRPERIILTQAFNQALENLREAALQKNLELFEEVDPNAFVVADREMLQTVLRNLISNAIKFTPTKGYIKFSNTLENNIQTIKICDSGIGMNNSILANLFVINANIGRPGTQGESSTGLGLLLCKEFIDKHRKRIWAESQEGQGSCFFFTLEGGIK